MECAEFEQELALVVGAERDDDDRDLRLVILNEHAAVCPACRGSIDLLDWLSLPSAERDTLEDPGTRYWSTFDRRLRDRFAHEAGARRRRRVWVAVSAAVVVGAAVVIPWLVWDRGPGAPIDEHVDAKTGPISDEWMRRLDGTDLAVAEREVDLVVGVDETWAAPEFEDPLIPAVGDLDDHDRRELLEWLETETERLEGDSA